MIHVAIPMPRARRIRRPRMGDGFYDPGDLSTVFQPGPVPVAPSCSWWDALWNNCGPSEAAQIQSVATNAATYYGAGSPVAVAAQTAANQQIAQVPADQANIQAFYANLNLPNQPFSLPWWFWAILGVGGVYLILKR